MGAVTFSALVVWIRASRNQECGWLELQYFEKRWDLTVVEIAPAKSGDARRLLLGYL